MMEAKSPARKESWDRIRYLGSEKEILGPSLDDGGISGLFSSVGPSVRFLTRYDGEVSEPLVGRQGLMICERFVKTIYCF